MVEQALWRDRRRRTPGPSGFSWKNDRESRSAYPPLGDDLRVDRSDRPDQHGPFRGSEEALGLLRRVRTVHLQRGHSGTAKDHKLDWPALSAELPADQR